MILILAHQVAQAVIYVFHFIHDCSGTVLACKQDTAPQRIVSVIMFRDRADHIRRDCRKIDAILREPSGRIVFIVVMNAAPIDLVGDLTKTVIEKQLLIGEIKILA